jgi:hypothetical protein
MKIKTELDIAYEEMGTENENRYKPIIENLYGPVRKTIFKYSVIDFVGENFSGELKSRNCSINDYNEFMIGFNKIETGFKKLKDDYKVYIWFAFKEGLYVWELNENNYELNGGKNQIRFGGTKNRGYDDFKDHYYIKKEFLTKLDDTPVWISQKVIDNTNRYKNPQKIPDEVCFLKLIKK